jgi:sulfite reductase alpha subunit-like flavoprotein
VLPTNCPALVTAALHSLGLTGSERFLWTAGSKDGPARGWGSITTSSPKALGDAMLGMRLDVPAAIALAYMADLSAPPPPKLLARLAAECPCPPEAAALAKLAAPEGYAAGVAGPKLTLVELLVQYRSVKFTLPELLNALPRLAPRYYSISSSPLADPRRCSVTVGLVSFT